MNTVLCSCCLRCELKRFEVFSLGTPQMFVIKLTGKILGWSLWAAQPASHPSSWPIFPWCMPRAGSRSPGALQGLLSGVAGMVGISQPTSGCPFILTLRQLRMVERCSKINFASLLLSCSSSLEPDAVRPKISQEILFSHSVQYLETSLGHSFCQEAL